MLFLARCKGRIEGEAALSALGPGYFSEPDDVVDRNEKFLADVGKLRAA